MAENKNVMIAVIAVAVIAVVAVGAFLIMNNGGNDDNETYYYFLNYGDNDVKTKWYSASGDNADDALTAALKDTGITADYGKSGYPSFSDAMWGVFVYDWSVASKTTSTESVVYPQYSEYNSLIKSNGWDSFSGYGSDAKKLYQSNTTIFYFAPYDSVTFEIKDPVADEIWQSASENNPFAAA